MKNLEVKIEKIAEIYAEIIEKRLISALKEDEIYSTALSEINDGIRMLNHITATLERINRILNNDITCN